MSDKSKLAELRIPFPERLINKLPKGTKAQNDCPANEKTNCRICGGWHHPKIIHLDYVGHAALTDRLLDVDPEWFWEPMAFRDGLPAFDAAGGLWIRLTVCGMSRIGYGNAAMSTFKDVGSREKEVIGDALRNASMRFGAALDLWFKGDLHAEEAPATIETKAEKPAQPKLINPLTKTPDYDLSDARAFELFSAAKLCVEHFEAGNHTAAFDEVSGISDGGEKLYLWAVLKEYSAVRAMIKKAVLVK